MTDERPPLGLTPKRVHDETRALDIIDALRRYAEAGKAVPPEWIDELAALLPFRRSA